MIRGWKVGVLDKGVEYIKVEDWNNGMWLDHLGSMSKNGYRIKTFNIVYI